MAAPTFPTPVLVPGTFRAPHRVALPTFRRRDITWRWADRDHLEVSIVVRNESSVPTDPAELIVETAGFGAFIPNTPMTRIALGGMDPGERNTVRGWIEAARLPGSPVLAQRRRAAAREARELLNSWALPTRSREGYLDRVEEHSRRELQLERDREAERRSSLGVSDDLLARMSPQERDAFFERARWITEAWARENDPVPSIGSSPDRYQWIGNLNVYVTGHRDRAVERHCAFGLRVPVGSTSFIDIETEGTPLSRWASTVSDSRWSTVLRPLFDRLDAGLHLFVTSPKEPGLDREVRVEVTRASDGRTVPVEFSFST